MQKIRTVSASVNMIVHYYYWITNCVKSGAEKWLNWVTACMTTTDQQPRFGWRHAWKCDVWYWSSDILIPSLLKAGVRRTRCATMERRGGLHGSGCVCAGGRGPSGASSSSPVAHQHSSCSSGAAPGPQNTDAPRHFLVSLERTGRKEAWAINLNEKNSIAQANKECKRSTTHKNINRIRSILLFIFIKL